MRRSRVTQTGGDRTLNPYELVVGQYVKAVNTTAGQAGEQEGVISNIDDDFMGFRTVTVNGVDFLVSRPGEPSSSVFTAPPSSPVPDTPTARTASIGSGKRTRTSRRRRTHNAVRKSTRHASRRR